MRPAWHARRWRPCKTKYRILHQDQTIGFSKFVNPNLRTVSVHDVSIEQLEQKPRILSGKQRKAQWGGDITARSSHNPSISKRKQTSYVPNTTSPTHAPNPPSQNHLHEFAAAMQFRLESRLDNKARVPWPTAQNRLYFFLLPAEPSVFFASALEHVSAHNRPFLQAWQSIAWMWGWKGKKKTMTSTRKKRKETKGKIKKGSKTHPQPAWRA